MARANSWFRFSALLLLCSGVYLSFVSAQEGSDKKKAAPKLFQLPGVLQKNIPPATVEELRDMEKHVQEVLKKVMPAVVGVRVGPGQGSGVIINEDGTILTAGHVSGKPDQTAVVILTNGKQHKGKTLGRNGGIDSGMMKISDEGKYPFLEMGNSSDLKPGQWVIAIGHPGGFRPNRTPVVRVGRILVVNQSFIRTDCTLVGGDSGGPLFDMQGRVIGIHSRIGGFAITENIHVPVDAFRRDWAKLEKAVDMGGTLGQVQTVRSAGGKVVFEKKDVLANGDPLDTVQKNSHAKIYTFRMKAGSNYTLDLISSDKSGKKLDTFLRLENAQGKELAQDDDGGGFPHSRIVFKAIRDDDYKIVATSFEANQTGPFTLKVSEADIKDSIVAGKVEVLKAIKVPLPAVGILIDTATKAKLPAHINAILLDAKGNPQPGKEITFQWDKGTEKLKSNTEGIVRVPLNKDKSKKLSFEVPKDLRAMLALTDPDGVYFPRTVDQSVETVKSGGGTIVKTFDGVIAKTDPFDVEREKCYRHVHEFKMNAGKTYTLDLVSEEFDSYLRIENDEKGKLAEDDDGGGFLNSRITFTPAADGTYRLVVTTCDPGQLGTYRLTIRESNAKAVEPKKDEKK